MIPLFYINLDSQTERRDWFEEQCATLGLTAIRVAATNGRALEPQALEAIRSKRVLDVHFGPAEIGCFLSHCAAWRMLLASDSDWGFIAEDDIHLATDSTAFFESSDWIPDDARLIKAESTFKKCHLGQQQHSVTATRHLRRLHSLHGGGGGYFLHREAAEILLQLAQTVAEPADLLVFNPDLGFFSEVIAYQIYPAIGAQDLFFEEPIHGFVKSTLEQERQTLRKHPSGAKLWREIKRPFGQLLNALRTTYETHVLGSKFEAVPFAPSPTAPPKILRKRFR